MPSRNLIIVGVAIFLGLIAVWLGDVYFSSVQQREVAVAQQNRLARIVVATQDVPFATPLTGQNVRLVNWPESSVPTGAFTSLEQATANRVALRPLVAGEPVLASNVSGNSARASIAANLPPGQVAYTIQINDVTGVGGFARPGDVVDVLMTRNMPGDSAGPTDKLNDLVLHAVPLLAIDTIADQSKSQPAVGKTATLQVSAADAQKLALASQIGVLSLALRNVADKSQPVMQTILPRDLSTGRLPMVASRATGPAATPGSAPAMPHRAPAAHHRSRPLAPPPPTMIIIRGTTPADYEVHLAR
ncbi:MAG TPA: Flp pilus assembly protein CpaB [Novosphingobium sp.]